MPPARLDRRGMPTGWGQNTLDGAPGQFAHNAENVVKARASTAPSHIPVGGPGDEVVGTYDAVLTAILTDAERALMARWLDRAMDPVS